VEREVVSMTALDEALVPWVSVVLGPWVLLNLPGPQFPPRKGRHQFLQLKVVLRTKPK
jgi:hypothetical protein